MSLFIITGASRGFGQAVAVAAAETFPDVAFLLSARDEAGLVSTKQQVSNICSYF